MTFQKGHKAFKGTEATRFQKGNIPWNKGKAFPAIQGKNNPNWKGGLAHCVDCNKQLSGYTSTYCNKCKGKVISEKKKGKYFGGTPWNKGKKLGPNPEHSKRMIGKLAGNKHPNWKGGITPTHFKIRNSLKYKEWRTYVFERDNYTCQDCGQHGGWLEAHHKKSFAKFPKDRFDIDNGITYCRPCHAKNDIYRNRTMEKI